jgi:putative PIG3 family NAD(P)H quinone oxidoreductase
MTAIPLAAHGGPEILQPQNLPVPPIGDGEVLIRVAAAGVNAPDIAQRKGFYDPPPGASPHLGLEVSGEIAAIGAAVSGWTVGDKVIALCNGGGYAEYVAVPFGQVLPLPANWSLVDGAALPETWFTVTQTLVMRAGIEKGMHVLIHGAAGGIGGAAIQIATILGARAIGVVSSPAKATYAMELGAVATIDHTSEDIVERTMALTGGKGADRILDMIGGEMTGKNTAASARFGHIVQVSTIGEPDATISLRTLMAKQMTLSGSTLRPQTPALKAAIAARMKADLWPALESPGFVRPRIRRFALADAAAAHRAMQERSNMGKILLVTSYGASLTDR